MGDRRIGPREARLRKTGAHESCKAECWPIRQAMLTDALEEALQEWDSLRDAFVDGRFTPDDRLGIGTEDAKKIAQLRAVLEEVDRG